MNHQSKLSAMTRISKAMDAVIPDITEISHEELLGYHQMIWATQLDIQNEWTRRKMSEEATTEGSDT